MLDLHLAEHLDAVSVIIVKKVSGLFRAITSHSFHILAYTPPFTSKANCLSHLKQYSYPFYSRASTFVREWYLSGRRFSYYDWSTPPSSSMRRSGSEVSSSPSTSSSSCPPHSSAPSSVASDYDSCDDDEDEREPLTPNTPLTPYYDQRVTGKENVPKARSQVVVRDVHLAPVGRMPLKRASWENAMTSSPSAPSFRP